LALTELFLLVGCTNVLAFGGSVWLGSYRGGCGCTVGRLPLMPRLFCVNGPFWRCARYAFAVRQTFGLADVCQRGMACLIWQDWRSDCSPAPFVCQGFITVDSCQRTPRRSYSGVGFFVARWIAFAGLRFTRNYHACGRVPYSWWCYWTHNAAFHFSVL